MVFQVTLFKLKVKNNVFNHFSYKKMIFIFYKPFFIIIIIIKILFTLILIERFRSTILLVRMGAKQSTLSISREDKKIENERRKNVQNHIISQRKEEISALENHVLSNSGVQDVKVLKEVIQASTYAQNQLNRGGKPFNKGDLVAIIVALDNKQVNNIDKLNNYRIEDLNALIRVLIYDSKNFMSPQNNMIMNSNNVTNQNDVKDMTNQNQVNIVNLAMITPPLPPKPKKTEKADNMLITNYIPPSYALVRR